MAIGPPAPYYNNPYIGVNAPIAGIGSSPLADHRIAAQDELQWPAGGVARASQPWPEFTVNYTYGQALTNSLGNYALNVNGFSGAFQNYYNSAADWGPAGYDVRHNLSANGVYALPFGRGQQFLSNVNRVGR